MKSRRKIQKEVAREREREDLHVVSVEVEMPTAKEVAAERARVIAYEQRLKRLKRDCERAVGNDSGSDGETTLRGELHALRTGVGGAAARAPRPAAALLASLAAALPAPFLRDYRLLLERRTEAEAQAATDELMRVVEATLSADGAAAAGGVALACWLGAACAWRGPRVPGAPLALHCLLQRLSQPQVTEVAEALREALEPRELLAVNDAVRGPLGRLLLRAARERLAGGGEELDAALLQRWGALDAAARLTALALAGRARAAALVAALQPRSQRDVLDPEYLKVSVSVKTLQDLLKDP